MLHRLRFGMAPLVALALFACGNLASQDAKTTTAADASTAASDAGTPGMHGDDGGAMTHPDATIGASDDAGSAGDAGGFENAGDAASDSSVVSDANEVPEACAPLGSGVVTLAAHQGTPYTLATGGGYVFWTALGGNVVRATPDGCSTVTLATGQADPVGIAVDDTNAYFTTQGQDGTDGGLFSVPIAGGPVTTLVAQQTDPYMVARYAGVTYWTDDVQGAGSVWSFANDAAAPLALGQNYPGGLVALASGVYWGTYDGTVIRAPLDGGVLQTIASGETTPRFFATDGESVVWTDSDDGLVLQMSMDGGAPIVLASGEAGPDGIATDGVNVYFTTQGTTGPVVPGSLYRVPLGGAATPVKLADGSGALSLAAVDGTSVYWIDGSSVMKLSPK